MSHIESEEQIRLVRYSEIPLVCIIILCYKGRARQNLTCTIGSTVAYSSVLALLSIVEAASYSYDGYNTNMAAILLHTGSIQTV